MAIKIGGKLENVQDPKGTIANASQIATQDGKSVEEVLSSIKENIDNIELTAEGVIYDDDSSVKDKIDFIEARVEEVAANPGVRKYTDLSMAQEDLDKAILTPGDVCAVAYTPEDTSEYSVDYKLYVVAQDTTGVGVLKELASGSSGGDAVVGKVMLTVDEFLIDGVNVLGETSYEANIGSTITFKYRFESEMYPDVRGTVYIRRGSTVIYNQKIFPNGELNTYTYKTDSLEAGTYTFTIYGAESTGRQSERSTFRVLVGGLNVQSTFDETKTLVAGEDLKIPVVVTTADPSSEITAHVSCDGSEVFSRKVSPGTSTLSVPGESLSIGIHTIKVWLTNTAGKTSNELEYNITIAEEGIIYLISDEKFSAAEGARLDILLRVIQVGQEEGYFNGTLVVVDKDGKEVRTSKYSLEYGQNLISLINLKHTESDGATQYTATITVEPTEDNTAEPVSKSFILEITENNYNISTLADDAMLCCFKSEGKTNNSVDKDFWEDLSGNNVGASFHNFNWSTNGWLLDEDGNTALMLNSGAYVELDITPFAKELEVGESMTISIDYSTKDILDSEAKVVSCLQETEGDESTIYYLRDNFSDYVKKGNDNIINYFKNIGGYCFINGETYSADGTTEYETTQIVSDRTPNYNLGDDNPAYDGKTDFRKKLGSSRQTVIKQRGFYIDTQYAVLSHSGSLSDVMQKFYLNFTEDTRNRMDFIITRNSSEDPSINPYCFQCMVGYTNGVLSLMKALSPEEKFEQANIRGDKFKVYLGGKGVINENDGSVGITQTGSAKIYSFRIYNRALTPGEILNNYAAEIPDMEKKKAVIDNNDILNTGNIAQLPQLCLIGYNKGGNPDNNTVKKFIMQLKDNGDTPISDLKAMKEPAYMTYTDPTDNSKSWITKDANGNETNIIPIRLQFQGTSSMVYPVKNYKFKMYEGFTESSTGKIEYIGKYKRDIGNGNRESTICLKAD